MANQQHLTIIKRGPEVWNEWRSDNPQIKPDLRGAKLYRADLINANLKDSDLAEVDLRDAYLINADLTGAILTQANLPGADLNSAILSRSDFSHTELSNTNFLNADLRGANLTHAKLRDADLGDARLRNSNLTNANLQSAVLTYTNLCHANLSGASLREADIRGADLTSAILKSADFTRTIVGWTSFANNDLSSTLGLNTIDHIAPSSVGIDTIYRSNGNIPEVFLRGTGMPEDFISYARTLVGNVIEFYSCFISYSSNNHDFAEKLRTDLLNKQVRCWFAPEDLKIGDKIRPRIDETIRLYDKLLLVLSEKSITSEWVEAEVEAALEKEREQGRAVLFPIRLDNAIMKVSSGWPALVKRTRHIGDFTEWKHHDSYQKSFQLLLRDLKAGDNCPGS